MAESVASASDVVVKERRQLGARACDRCRRRKCKCHLLLSGNCAQCLAARAACTFDLPTARRGPKAKKKATADGNTPSFSDIPPLRFDQHSPTGRLSFGTSTTSQQPWSASSATALDANLLPRSITSPPDSPEVPVLARWTRLVDQVTARGLHFEAVVNQCIDLFFEYLYPLTPLVHEPSLRDNLAYFVPSDRAPHLETCAEAAFTLITAVCAEAAFLLPADIFPSGDAVASVFLHASRGCLADYMEADLESPSASSITIRYFHSNCVHAAGKPKFSWHIFGEATRLAQVMRLHDETSYEGLYPVEAEMRRRVFWIVYMGDKSAAILNNRPITMHKYSFECGVTATYPTGIEEESQTPVSPNSVHSSEPASTKRQKLILGFNANIRLWSAASDLLLALRVIQDQAKTSQDGGLANTLSPPQREIIDPLYIAFITSLDDLPSFLKSHSFAPPTSKSETSQSNQFTIQCANLQVSMHCLRMVVVQKFEHLSYLTAGMEQTDLQKTDIVRDALRVIHEVPFWALQLNGEPYVEKLRLIGASLMAIIHRNPNSPIAARARGDFDVLLDVLTRLDSKASDALRNHSSWIL
ncbi:C6 transcription [Cordyceps militaris]|uniref:C6 transcription n=1 Tax=Cordyceps militaris TaxID=73501 RepID=A0A2H4S9H7_CORMI|nr:C6 transcription [Cordyceps militaris]